MTMQLRIETVVEDDDVPAVLDALGWEEPDHALVEGLSWDNPMTKLMAALEGYGFTVDLG